MAPLSTNERLREAFSLALEDRSAGYADLVSNSNALLYKMREKDQFETYSGPSIRETLHYAQSGTYKRYAGYMLLNPQPAELFGDAEFRPKQAAVSVSLAGDQILNNNGRNQIKSVMKGHISSAETELLDRFTEDLHSDGTADGGLQIGGLQKTIPTNPALGTYGGISRADHAIWRTSAYDVQSAFGAGITQVDKSTIKTIFDTIIARHSRQKSGVDLILASESHWLSYTASLVEIQRITNESKMGKLGFQSLKYAGNGREIDVVLEGGVGSAMPPDVTYFMDCGSIKFRYNEERNFAPLGPAQRPINQDAMVQHIGFIGELTMNNPLFNVKLFDSNPAA